MCTAPSMLRPWQHSEGPNIEGAVYAAIRYGVLPVPFLSSPFLTCPLSSPLVLKDPLRPPAECCLSQTQNPDRAPGGADSCAAFKIFLSQVAAISCFSVKSTSREPGEGDSEQEHFGNIFAAISLPLVSYPHPTHPLRVGGGDPPLRVPPRMWFREGQKVLECLSCAPFWRPFW